MSREHGLTGANEPRKLFSFHEYGAYYSPIGRRDVEILHVTWLCRPFLQISDPCFVTPRYVSLRRGNALNPPMGTVPSKANCFRKFCSLRSTGGPAFIGLARSHHSESIFPPTGYGRSASVSASPHQDHNPTSASGAMALVPCSHSCSPRYTDSGGQLWDRKACLPFGHTRCGGGRHYPRDN